MLDSEVSKYFGTATKDAAIADQKKLQEESVCQKWLTNDNSST